MPRGIYKHPPQCGFQKGHKGYKNKGSFQKGHPVYFKHHTEATKRKISEMSKGEKGNNWKGGISKESHRIREGIEFRLWRESVFSRDNYTCQKCGQRGYELHPHHIQNFAQYLELRFAIDNGITFCRGCHKEFHKKYGQKNNTKEQIEEFLKVLAMIDLRQLGITQTMRIMKKTSCRHFIQVPKITFKKDKTGRVLRCPKCKNYYIR